MENPAPKGAGFFVAFLVSNFSVEFATGPESSRRRRAIACPPVTPKACRIILSAPPVRPG